MQAIAQKAMLFILSLFDNRLDLDAAYAKIDADKAKQAKSIEDQRKSRTDTAQRQKNAEMEANRYVRDAGTAGERPGRDDWPIATRYPPAQAPG